MNTQFGILVLSYFGERTMAAPQPKPKMSVSEDQWNAICYELDSPPKSNPALRKLLESKRVFENS